MSETRPRFVIDFAGGEVVAQVSRYSGHDVVFIGDYDPRTHDSDILRLTAQEQRIVVTLGTDFGDFVYRFGEPHADAGDRLQAIQEFIADHGSNLSGRFRVYRRGRLRVR